MHCPNTGAMTGCADPGSRVWYSTSADPKRKYPNTLEIVETAAGHRIGINSARANAVVDCALDRGRIEEIQARNVRREVRLPDAAGEGAGGRIDFVVAAPTGRDCYIEVKSVTLMLDDGWGAFPDAVSARATRHVEALARIRASGARAVLLFCVQHTGITRVRPADHIDATYARALRHAVASGVEVLAYGCAVDRLGIELCGRLPVALSLD